MPPEASYGDHYGAHHGHHHGHDHGHDHGHHHNHHIHPPDETLYWESQKDVTTHTGTLYPGCTEDELRELRHAHEWIIDGLRDPNPARTPHVSVPQAAFQLERWLALPPDLASQEAIQRLAQTVHKRPFTPDVVIKAFNDLNRAYFARVLEGKVGVMWKGSSKGLKNYMNEEGVRCIHGLTMFDRRWMLGTRIIMNAFSIFMRNSRHTKRRESFGTLMHEMIHAFFNLSCGPTHPENHGEYFCRLAKTITNRTKKEIGLAVHWRPDDAHTDPGKFFR